MIKNIEHLGIAVKNLDASISLYERLLNVSCYKREKVNSENVETAFFKNGETKIELLASTSEDGVIAKFIERKGEGIHHMALEVDNIFEEMQRLKAEGFTFISEVPKEGADNKLICFLHPKSTKGLLVELCQEKAL